MELVLEDAKLFKSCVDAIVSLVDEGSFQLAADGLRLRTMDPSQIAMVDFHLPKEAFASYDPEGAPALGLNLVDVSKVLARARAGERLTMSAEEKDNKFLLEFSGASKRAFKLPLLDLAGTSPREPKIAFDAEVSLRGGTFKDLLRDAAILSSHLVLEASDGELVVEAHGDSGDLRVETKKGPAGLAAVSARGKNRAMYPSEYLDNMTKTCPDDALLTLWLKTDAPVKVSYELGKAKLAYYLAPRVENA